MSPEQKDLVLEAIAGRANTLNRLLMVLQSEKDAWSAGALIDAAQIIAETLGAMADDAKGGSVIGDMHFWFYGPHFKDSK